MTKDYREYQRELADLKRRIGETYSAVGIDAHKKRLDLLEKEAMKEDFWQDRENFTVVSQEISHLKKKVEQWEDLMNRAGETVELLDLALSEEDAELLNDVCLMIEPLSVEFNRLETLELLSEEDDHCNSFITIHPGAGGTESQDWASILFRMYSRWAEGKDFHVEVIDYTAGEEAGIKSATMLVKGENSYGLLKCERGIHRLVRISPFDSNKRRHTSFASVEAMPELPDDIDVEILDSDLKIDTYRASGAGGQHVNTTDSAVRITHIPTGIVVQCQNERSQHKNRSSAMKLLKSRLYTLRKKEHEEKKLEKSGQKSDISWGNQIRSYVLQPYTLIKDHRTEEETSNIEAVLEDGEIDRFIYSYLSLLKINA